jgi:hypothetical protein
MLVRPVPSRRLSAVRVALLSGLVASSVAGCSAEVSDGASGENDDAIVGGVVSGPEDDAVAVFGAPDGVGFCSGTLIAPNLVLTAKHCVRAKSAAPRYSCTTPSEDLGALRPAGVLTVLFGHDLSGDMEPHAVARVVDDGRLDLCDRDVAVLILETPVTTIAPRALRTTALAPGETMTAVGWGMTERGIPDKRRKRAGVTVLPSSNEGGGAVGKNEILTSTAVCQGDSGGPLFDASGRVVSVVSRVRSGCIAGNGVHLLVRAQGVLELVERAKSGT